MLAARLVGGGGSIAVALLPADVASASAVEDIAELLDVDVEHGARMVVLVAADGFAGGAVDVGQAIQVGVGQDPVDGGGCDAESRGELDGPSRGRRRRRMQRRVVLTLILFGEWWGREERSCMDWPARYRSAQRFTVGQETWKRAATSLIGHPSSTTSRATIRR